MNTQDKEMLRRWVTGRASLAEVERASPVGLVDNVRFTETARRAYRLLWTWSAYRLSDPACMKQHRTRVALGREGLERRFERCRRIIDRIKTGDF